MKTLIGSILGLFFISGAFSFGAENLGTLARCPASSPDPNTTPEGLSDADWSGIRAVHEGKRHAITPDSDGNYRATNPGQAWVTRFDGRGFTVTPDAGGWEWGLELEGFGEVAEVRNEGGKLSYMRDGGLVEWFINDRRGLEQGWTLAERPQDTERGAPLQLRLSIRGGLRPQVAGSGTSVAFVNSSGGTALTYGGLKAWDSDGKTLPVHFVGDENNESQCVVEVDDSGARYPLIIDPIAQQAYLKASNTGWYDSFGSSVSISGDTVVVGADGESSSATGINGNELDNSASTSGAAYVFVRNGTTWSQEAYLKASNTRGGDRFGYSVSISGDTIVVGAYGEDSNATGINGNEANDSLYAAGAAYVFVRSGTTWSQEAYLKASNTGTSDQFGYSVSISGDTVVVGAYGERSNATGINGDGANNLAPSAGAAYVFVRSGTTWSQEAYLKASNTEDSDKFGYSVAVSGDTVVIGAYQEDSKATGINGNGANNSGNRAGAAYVFVRSGTTWSQEAYLKASNTGADDKFGYSVSVSGDTLVVGAYQEDGGTTGINGNEADNSAAAAGAVYVFVRSGTTWSQEAYIKASNTGDNDNFGYSVAVSGDTLVVGAYHEDSSATGINGDEADEFAYEAGAAYFFVRSGTTWSQEAYLKASNTEWGDLFGSSVTVSGDTLVVGAFREDSNATGIDGDQSNNSGDRTGAAYVFVFDGFGSNTLSISATNGSVDGSGEYPANSTAILTATPNLGFLFDSWSGDASGTDNPLNLVMDSNKAVVANFVPDTSDTDGDGLSAYQELVVYGTDPDQADTDGDCLTDGYEVGVGRYSLVSGSFTWAQAKAAAESSSGYLATFTSQEEWDIAMLSIGPGVLDAITGAWIGATDAAEEGTWTWVTGEPFSFSLWAAGQPDDSSNSDVAEISGGLGPMVGKWFDAGAGGLRDAYILEIGYTTDPTVADTDCHKPTILDLPADIVATTDLGLPTATVNWVEPTAADNIAVTSFTSDHSPGDAFPTSVTTVTYTATDAAGNSTTASFTVTVTDGEKPVIGGLPANIAVPTDPGLPSAVVNWGAPTASDNVGVTSFNSTHNPGDTFPPGSTTVTYSATDVAGNVCDASFTVSVGDSEKPVISGLPDDIVVQADPGNTTAVANWDEPIATDNVGVISFVPNFPSGSEFPIGETVVYYTAEDAAGNRSYGAFLVTVEQSEAGFFLDPISISDDLAPGTGGSTFRTYQRAFINENDLVVFGGTVVDGDSGVWFGDVNVVNAVAVEGDAAAGAGAGLDYGIFTRINITDADDVSFNSQLTGAVTSSTDVAHFAELGGGSLEIQAREGNAAPGTGGNFAAIHASVAGAGVTAFPARLDISAPITSQSDTGIWSSHTGALELVAWEGQDVDAIPGARYGHIKSSMAMNETGEMAFIASLAGAGSANVAVFSGLPGALDVAFRRGEVAPDTGGATFRLFAAAAVGGTGDTAVFASLSNSASLGVSSSNNDGIWTNIGGTIAKVAREGDQVPGLPAGIIFESFRDILVADDGSVCFSGFVDGPGVNSTNDGCLWSNASGSLTVLMREGGLAPGTDGAQIKSIIRFTRNNNDLVGVVADMVTGIGDATGGNAEALWLSNPETSEFDLALRTGMSFEIAPGDSRTVTIIQMDKSTNVPGAGGGSGRVSNDIGHVAVILSYNLGSGVFIVGRLPEL